MLNVGVLTGICLLVYSGILFYQSWGLDYYTPMGPGPGFLPLWLSGILFVISLFYIAECIKGEGISLKELFPRGGMLYDMVFMFVGLCFTGLFLEEVGFVTCGSLLLFLMTFRKYKWYYALPSSIVITFIIFTVFQTCLGVPLPINEFGW